MSLNYFVGVEEKSVEVGKFRKLHEDWVKFYA